MGRTESVEVQEIDVTTKDGLKFVGDVNAETAKSLIKKKRK